MHVHILCDGRVCADLIIVFFLNAYAAGVHVGLGGFQRCLITPFDCWDDMETGTAARRFVVIDRHIIACAPVASQTGGGVALVDYALAELNVEFPQEFVAGAFGGRHVHTVTVGCARLQVKAALFVLQVVITFRTARFGYPYIVIGSAGKTVSGKRRFTAFVQSQHFVVEFADYVILPIVVNMCFG